MARERQINVTTYKRNTLRVPVENFSMGKLNPGASIEDVFVHKSGEVERDGVSFDYFELRVYVRPPAK